jgi:MerR family transcriptional regulator, copper efflux regulator
VESQVSEAPPLKIGEVASRSGLPVKTIRFYCDQGLIRPSGRSEGGYRLFDGEVFTELQWIRTLKGMEIPLQDMQQILESRRSGMCTCIALQTRIRAKAGEIGQKIEALHTLQSELLAMLNSWQDCGGSRTGAAARVPSSARSKAAIGA